MLQSMIKNPRPTRTEVTDIANAVYMRADALMLSGETAYGSYPVEAVKTMVDIAMQAEKDVFADNNDVSLPLSDSCDMTEFFAKEAVNATHKMQLRAIIMDSYTGRTARYVSSFRGQCTILAICYQRTPCATWPSHTVFRPSICPSRATATNSCWPPCANCWATACSNPRTASAIWAVNARNSARHSWK